MNPPNDDFAELRKIVRGNRQKLTRLSARIEMLEKALELVCDDDQMLWLYRNRSERMDPQVPFFKPDRARFHLARYEFASQFVSGQAVADIACGTGYGAKVLLETGQAASYIGIDVCPEAVEYARSHYGAATTTFQCARGEATCLQAESVGRVVCFEAIEHVDDDRALLQEFQRILRPDGILICSTPNQWPLEIAPHHTREYNRESFVAALEQFFLVEQMHNQNSGSDFKYNHGQPAGIQLTSDENEHLAECFIAVARKQ